jgi:hypothetical protein
MNGSQSVGDLLEKKINEILQVQGEDGKGEKFECAEQSWPRKQTGTYGHKHHLEIPLTFFTHI